MLDTVKINHVQHISFTQSRLTDAVSVILSELLSYEHSSKQPVSFLPFSAAIPVQTEKGEDTASASHIWNFRCPAKPGTLRW